jgi:ribosomal protein S18 acetylase RimI-like enzyme
MVSTKIPPKMQFEIRLMRKDDLQQFLDIRNSIRQSLHDSREFNLTECEIWFKNKPQDYWVAISEHKIIGYFRFEMDTDSPNTGIVGMDLDPLVHGRGFAKSLYRQFCEEIIPKYGATQLRLRVLKSNDRAFALYTSMGMAISEETQVDYEMKTSVKQLLVRLSEKID